MDKGSELEALRAFSAGRISRIDVAQQLGQPLDFGELLVKLHEHRLPLPRYPRDPNSPGVELIRRLAEQAKRVRR